MVISKTPFRVSFFGGGTDYPDYFLKNSGAVLSTTIDKYSFITVKSLYGLSEYKYKITYSRLELCQDVSEIVHPAVRECIKFMKMPDGLEVHVINELPARTGIGSSSTFTVGLLNALYAFNGQMATKDRLAKDAVYVEQTLLGERVGVQDQYAASFGGLNFMEFQPDGTVRVNPVTVSQERRRELQDNLLLFYTGISRHAHAVLEEQIQKTKENKNTPDLSRMRKMVDEGVEILCSKDGLQPFGELLHTAWLAKKNLSSAISNNHLDGIYDAAYKAGALGGKLLGAGGGGFFLFFVEKKNQDRVRQVLQGYPEVKFGFETDGTRIIFVS
jgi:D-glycero-alpha-D-manno-heptose-7-phosphate kinase